PAEEFRGVLGALTVSISGLVILAFLFNARYSKLWLALAWSVALLLALVTRRAWHLWITRARASGRLSYRTLIIGANDEAVRLVETLRSRFRGFEVVGSVSTANDSEPMASVPRFGSIEELEDAIHAAGADCVFVASSAVTPNEMAKV